MSTDKRIVNVRILFVALIGIISGILFSYLVVKCACTNKFDFYIVPLGLVFLFFIVLLVASIIKSKNKFVLFANKYFSSIVSFIVLFAIGAGCTAIKLNGYLKLSSFDTTYQISCVAENVYKYDSYANITTSKFKVNGTEVKQSATLTIYYDSDNGEVDLKIGQELSFDGAAILTPLFDSSSNLVDYLYGKAYNIQIDYDDISLGESHAKLDGTIRQHVYNLLVKEMGTDNSGIAYTMLFGDREHLSSNISQMFSYAGIAHILAVSGLHIGILAGLVAWVLKRLRANKYAILAITGIMLLAYCYLCGFTPSVVRASIMSIIMLIAYVSGKEYDVLSSLSLAAIITLIVNPFNLFATGFQLSYLSVLCIITLSNSIDRLLTKIKIPNFIAKTFSVSVCINIIILPVCVNAFNNVSLMGVLANVFVLPLFAVLFPLLFVATFISAILPFMSFVLFLPNVLLHALKYVANFFAGLKFFNFKLYNLSFLVLFALILILLVIKYLMIKPNYKAILCGVLVAVIAICGTINMISNTYNGVFAMSYQYSSNSAVVSIYKGNFLIGTNNKYIDTMLKKLKIRQIDYIIGYDLDLNNIDYINNVIEDYEVKRIYIPSTLNESVKDKFNCNCSMLDYVSVGRFRFDFVYNSADESVGLKVNTGGKTIVFANSNNSDSDDIQLLNNVDDVDYVICNNCNIPQYMLEGAKLILHNGQMDYPYTNINGLDKYVLRV